MELSQIHLCIVPTHAIHTSCVHQYLHTHTLNASTPVVCHIQPLSVHAITLSVTTTPFLTKNTAFFQSLFAPSPTSTTPANTHPQRQTTYVGHGIIECSADIIHTGYTYIRIDLSVGVYTHLCMTSTTTRAATPLPIPIHPS